MTTTTQHAIDLMPQIRAIVAMPEDLDLPRLARAQIEATSESSGWTATAQLGWLPTDPESWEALRAWGGGQQPELGNAHRGGVTESKSWRQASVTITVGEVSLKVWCHVDGKFVPPEQVHVTGPVAAPIVVPGYSTYSDPAVRAAIRDTLAGGAA